MMVVSGRNRSNQNLTDDSASNNNGSEEMCIGSSVYNTANPADDATCSSSSSRDSCAKPQPKTPSATTGTKKKQKLKLTQQDLIDMGITMDDVISKRFLESKSMRTRSRSRRSRRKSTTDISPSDAMKQQHMSGEQVDAGITADDVVSMRFVEGRRNRLSRGNSARSSLNQCSDDEDQPRQVDESRSLFTQTEHVGSRGRARSRRASIFGGGSVRSLSYDDSLLDGQQQPLSPSKAPRQRSRRRSLFGGDAS